MYIDAFVPAQGESVLSLAGKFPGSQLPASITEAPYAAGPGQSGVDVYINPADFGPRGPVMRTRRGGQLARNPHVTAEHSRRQKHSTSSKPASRSALSSTSSGKYRSSSDHAAKWPRASASVMP